MIKMYDILACMMFQAHQSKFAHGLIRSKVSDHQEKYSNIRPLRRSLEILMCFTRSAFVT